MEQPSLTEGCVIVCTPLGMARCRNTASPIPLSLAPARCRNKSLFLVTQGMSLCLARHSLPQCSLNRTCRELLLSGHGDEVYPALSG